MSRPRKYQQAAELKRLAPDVQDNFLSALDKLIADDEEQCEWFDDEPSSEGVTE